MEGGGVGGGGGTGPPLGPTITRAARLPSYRRGHCVARSPPVPFNSDCQGPVETHTHTHIQTHTIEDGWIHCRFRPETDPFDPTHHANIPPITSCPPVRPSVRTLRRRWRRRRAKSRGKSSHHRMGMGSLTARIFIHPRFTFTFPVCAFNHPTRPDSTLHRCMFFYATQYSRICRRIKCVASIKILPAITGTKGTYCKKIC